jgi:NAD(P)-dependent dehydrogenase (short-subunit alcohol dehydrogenase family)
MQLTGKTALITGASRGIGRAIAATLASAGARTYITGRNASNLAATAQEIGAFSLPCDHTSESDSRQLFERIRQEAGKLDLLINNAGNSHGIASVDALSLADWQRVIALNLTGTFLATHFALPLMPDGATIVNNLSIAARQVFQGQSAYIASKHGAYGFTKALREELRPRRIRVVALIPGATSTEIWEAFWPEAPREKMIAPETVAQLVLQAVTLPPEASLDELVIAPSVGVL